MTILIRMPNELEETYAIVELQGDLKSETNINGKLIGNLHFTTSGTPLLIIGHHLLHGKETMLDKPFALIKKQRSDETGAEYTVKTIITKRLLFKTRPKPIVGTPEGKK